MKTTNAWLALEELSPLVTPSATPTAPPAAGPVLTAPPATPPALPSHPLHGTGGGAYTRPLVVDAGTSYPFAGGTVTLKNLGTFTVTGSVQGVGFVTSGRPTGHLVLVNAHGSITLELHGQPMPGFSPPPSELVYSIRGGTGDYATAKGYGIAAFKYTPAPTAAGVPAAGTFTIAFQ